MEYFQPSNQQDKHFEQLVWKSQPYLQNCNLVSLHFGYYFMVHGVSYFGLAQILSTHVFCQGLSIKTLNVFMSISSLISIFLCVSHSRLSCVLVFLCSSSIVIFSLCHSSFYPQPDSHYFLQSATHTCCLISSSTPNMAWASVLSIQFLSTLTSVLHCWIDCHKSDFPPWSLRF